MCATTSGAMQEKAGLVRIGWLSGSTPPHLGSHTQLVRCPFWSGSGWLCRPRGVCPREGGREFKLENLAKIVSACTRGGSYFVGSAGPDVVLSRVRFFGLGHRFKIRIAPVHVTWLVRIRIHFNPLHGS